MPFHVLFIPIIWSLYCYRTGPGPSGTRPLGNPTQPQQSTASCCHAKNKACRSCGHTRHEANSLSSRIFQDKRWRVFTRVIINVNMNMCMDVCMYVCTLFFFNLYAREQVLTEAIGCRMKNNHSISTAVPQATGLL